MLLLLGGCGAKPVVVPTSFEPFIAIDKSFAGVGPSGWDKQEFGGGDTYAKTVWTSGAAKIEVKSDTANSFMGDIGKAGGKKPVDTVHEKVLAGLSEEMGEGFSAQATQPVASAWGEARYTEWTQNDTHGVRITTMMPDRSLGLVAQCPEADWANLKDPIWKVWTGLKAAGQ